MEGQRHVPKYGKIRHLVKNLIKNQKEDFDAVLVVSGREGVGKSTLAIEIARLVQEAYGRKFNYDSNMAYNANEAIEKMKNLQQYDVLLLDEGMRLAWRRQWFNTEQRKLARLFSQIRSRNLCLIFSIPDFMHIDTYYREHRVLYWLHVIDRGYAVLFAPDTTAGARDRWGIEQAQKQIRLGKRRATTTFDDTEAKLRKHKTIPSFVDWFQFPPLPDYEKYREISNRRKLEEDEDEEPADKWHHSRLMNGVAKLKNERGFSSKDLSLIFNVDARTINGYVKRARSEAAAS